MMQSSFNKKILINSIASIPDTWALVPVTKDKRPVRSGWQTESPIPHETVATLIKEGDKRWSPEKQNHWTASYSGVGLRTGKYSNGLLAIDVDGLSAQPLLERISGGNRPRTVAWTSGKAGRHQELYQLSEPLQKRLDAVNFTHRAISDYAELKTETRIKANGKEEKEQLDFRYSDCQSVLPPSKHPETGLYRWIKSPQDCPVANAPDWLEGWLNQICDDWESRQAKKLAQADKPHNNCQGQSVTSVDADDTERARELIKHIDLSPLHWEAWAGCILGAKRCGLSHSEVYAWSKRSSEHTDEGFKGKWDTSRGNNPATIGTLIYHAKKQGFTIPANKKVWDKDAWLRVTQEEQDYYSRLDVEPTHKLTAEYIPEGWVSLPKESGIIIIEAPMKSGKTQAALKGLVTQHRQQNPDGQQALFVPRNNLGRQAGLKLGLAHHEETGNSFSISNNRGFTSCLESGPKFDPKSMPQIELMRQSALEFGQIVEHDNRPLFLFDEPSQTFEQILEGKTCKTTHIQVLNRLLELLRYVAKNQGWVVLSEDGITNLEVDLIRDACGLEVVDYYKFTKDDPEALERTYEIFTQSPTMTLERIEEMLAEDPYTKLWICSDAKEWIDDTAEMLKRLGFSDQDMLVATSDTSGEARVKAFTQNPDKHKHKYKFVLASPSIQSGTSCEDPEGHFSAVAFHLVGMPARTAKQLPERLRTNVPRFGYVAEFAVNDSDDYSASRAESIIKNAFTSAEDVHRLVDMATWYQKNEPYTDENGNKLDLIATQTQLQKDSTDITKPMGLFIQYAAKYKARSHWGRQSIRADYIGYLKSRGFNVKEVAGFNTRLKEERIDIRESIDRQRSEEFAGLEIPVEMTIEEAKRILNSDDASREIQLAAKKLLLSDRYPGVNLYDAELVNRCFITEHGKFAKSTELLWKAQNPDKAIWLDRWSHQNTFNSAAFNKTDVWIFGLTNHSMKAKLLSDAPLEPFLSGSVERWDGMTPEAQTLHAWAYTHRWQLKRHLNMNIKEPITETSQGEEALKPDAHKVVNKFLKKLGFATTNIRVGPRSSQVRFYKLADDTNNTDRASLLDALTRRFDERRQRRIDKQRSDSRSQKMQCRYNKKQQLLTTEVANNNKQQQLLTTGLANDGPHIPIPDFEGLAQAMRLVDGGTAQKTDVESKIGSMYACDHLDGLGIVSMHFADGSFGLDSIDGSKFVRAYPHELIPLEADKKKAELVCF